MAFNQPLDLKYWLVNVFAGNIVIFYFLSLIIIASIAAKFRMNTAIYVPMILIYTFILANVSDIGQSGLIQGLIFITILILGLIFYPILGRVFR